MNEKVIAKARRKAARLKRLRRDARYLKVLGTLKREGLLDVRDVPAFRGQVFLQEALWAAELEPRIFELLPAILVRRPRLFAFLELPADLEAVVTELRGGHPKTPYQGIDPRKYERWMEFVGRRKARPKVMRSFRLEIGDVEILERLAEKRNASQSEIIHQALSALVG